MRETARTVVAYLRALYNFCAGPLPKDRLRRELQLLRGLAPDAPQTRVPRPDCKLAQIVAAKSSPASSRPHEEEGGGVRSGPGVARTILLFHIISARPSKQPLKGEYRSKQVYIES